MIAHTVLFGSKYTCCIDLILIREDATTETRVPGYRLDSSRPSYAAIRGLLDLIRLDSSRPSYAVIRGLLTQ